MECEQGTPVLRSPRARGVGQSLTEMLEAELKAHGLSLYRRQVSRRGHLDWLESNEGRCHKLNKDQVGILEPRKETDREQEESRRNGCMMVTPKKSEKRSPVTSQRGMLAERLRWKSDCWVSKVSRDEVV